MDAIEGKIRWIIIAPNTLVLNLVAIAKKNLEETIVLNTLVQKADVMKKKKHWATIVHLTNVVKWVVGMQKRVLDSIAVNTSVHTDGVHQVNLLVPITAIYTVN